MKEFEQYIKKMTLSIDDVGIRRDISMELYEHLMESYEKHIALGKSHKEAIQITLDKFGEGSHIGEDLYKVHTPKIRWWHMVIISFVVTLFIAAIYGYFYFVLLIQ